MSLGFFFSFSERYRLRKHGYSVLFEELIIDSNKMNESQQDSLHGKYSVLINLK